MYTHVLSLHSWLRWLTLLLAIGATLNAFRADTDLSRPLPGRQWDTFFMMALDVQVLFGVLLYFGLSPFTRAAFADLSGAMGQPSLRFWTVEHAALMFAAVVLVRVGRIRALNAPTSQLRRRRRLTFFALTTAVILAGIPWPGLANGRPLFRV